MKIISRSCTLVEAVGICDVPSGPLPGLGFGHYIPGFAKLVETVRGACDGQPKRLLAIPVRFYAYLSSQWLNFFMPSLDR